MGLDTVLHGRSSEIFGAVRYVQRPAKYLTVHSPHAFKKEERGWTREQVAAVVREIIIDQVGVKDFTEDSHFIDDMHLD